MKAAKSVVSTIAAIRINTTIIINFLFPHKTCLLSSFPIKPYPGISFTLVIFNFLLCQCTDLCDGNMSKEPFEGHPFFILL